MLSQNRYPRIANPTDIPRLVSMDNVRFEWPPPGTTVIPSAFPEPWVVVQGEPTEGDADTWWVTTLENIAGYFSFPISELLYASARWSPAGSVVDFARVVGKVPVIYSPGEGKFMRWIRSTHRFILGGGVEQGQIKFDWGVPGNDPTLVEGDAMAVADSLSAQFAAAWIAVVAPQAQSVGGDFSPAVEWTEVGVASWLQDQAKNADGTGGDAHQEYPNAWSAWATASRPKGTSAQSLPFEVACAVTLQTDKRGPSGRGRVYMPPMAVGVMNSNTGLFQTGPVDRVGLFVGKFFDNVRAAHDFEPIVVSMRLKQLHEITEVNVGLVPDAQRRRRRSQAEARRVTWTKV